MDFRGKRVAVLGSTGSIGMQTLSVCRGLGLRVTVLSANSSVELLEAQAREFLPDLVVVSEKYATGLRVALADTPVRVTAGSEALSEAAAMSGTDIVVGAIVGIAGLAPVLSAARAGKIIALANKEALVCGGIAVMKAAGEHGARIIPVDSEHSAIFQCLQAGRREDVTGILLTASGGPFFGMSREELGRVTPSQALRHPNWQMGHKVTLDSATLMNKGLELIEAMRLFELEPEQIEIVIHRQSVLHSAVSFADGSLIAQMGVADMRMAIQYALTWPRRYPIDGMAKLSLTGIGGLSFEEPDREVFACLSACELAARRGGLYPAAVNAAGETASEAFMEGRISFTRIGELTLEVVRRLELSGCETSLDAIFHADAMARAYVSERI